MEHVLVVGPGLGRDQHMQDCARIAFELAREIDQMSVVVDADGLWLVQVCGPRTFYLTTAARRMRTRHDVERHQAQLTR